MTRSVNVELRPLALSDAEILASLDPAFCRHAGWTPGGTFDATLSWWRESIVDPDPLLTRLVALHDAAIVGYVDLHGEGTDPRELGFAVGPSSRWRQGWGSAAAHAGVAYGFSRLGLSIIWAEAVEANAGPVRALRRIGMKVVGTGDSETFLGEPSRYLRFRMLREDWPAEFAS